MLYSYLIDRCRHIRPVEPTDLCVMNASVVELRAKREVRVL